MKEKHVECHRNWSKGQHSAFILCAFLFTNFSICVIQKRRRIRNSDFAGKMQTKHYNLDRKLKRDGHYIGFATHFHKSFRLFFLFMPIFVFQNLRVGTFHFNRKLKEINIREEEERRNKKIRNIADFSFFCMKINGSSFTSGYFAGCPSKPTKTTYWNHQKPSKRTISGQFESFWGDLGYFEGSNKLS